MAAVRVQVPGPDYNLNELIMEMYGNTLCVSFTELVRGGIISKPTYDKYVREGKLTLLQRGGNGREALIAYRSMPERLRAAYDDTFKNAYEEMKQREQEKYINTQIRFDAEAVRFFKEFEPRIEPARQLEYILNAPGDERNGAYGEGTQCGTRQRRFCPSCGNMEQRADLL